ncbi:helix-turn-helix domain-containing protein [Nocardioides sp.]|uniref:helix-turn-helix domain-containing protein n=1 Tax=Nocardioides sp. TaxID=35761 RepID=UPI00352788A3
MTAEQSPPAADDPRILRAIAHPVRNRILAELEAAGSLRAADVAATVGIPANQASFHLRQLAKYGVVEPAPELARDRRDRVWRLVGGELVVNVSDIEKAPGGRAAAAVWRRQAVAAAHEVVERAYAGDPDHRSTILEASVRLSPEAVTEFTRELGELVDRWNDPGRDRGAEAATYHVLNIVQRYPADTTDDPGAGG